MLIAGSSPASHCALMTTSSRVKAANLRCSKAFFLIARSSSDELQLERLLASAHARLRDSACDFFEVIFMICPVRLRDASGHRQNEVSRKKPLKKVTQQGAIKRHILATLMLKNTR